MFLFFKVVFLNKIGKLCRNDPLDSQISSRESPLVWESRTGNADEMTIIKTIRKHLLVVATQISSGQLECVLEP